MTDVTFHIMAVCHGNICRSPMAEVVLRARLADAGLADAVAVSSAGVSDEEAGNPIDRRAVDVLRERGYDVPRHVARKVTKEDVRGADLILAMASRHRDRVLKLSPSADVRLYREFDPEADGDLEIDDPWYGGYGDFEDVLAQLEAGADGVLAEARRAITRR